MKELIPAEVIEKKILLIRDHKVMLDADIAALYRVATKVLNQAVKRNIERFPEDFMFQLTKEEKRQVVTDCDHLRQLKFSPNLPFAFTEHGAIMAATVLNSAEAVAISVYVVRAFVKMRERLAANETILKRLAEIDKTLLNHDQALKVIWQKLQPLLQPLPGREKRKIGFKRESE